MYDSKLISMQRWNALERDIARNTSLVGEAEARIAQVKERISEVDVQITQVDRERVAEANKEMRETETKIAELQERRAAAEDQLRRVDIKAPASGIVHELAFHTVGGIVNQGEPLMVIVPENGALIVETRVPPHEIDQVRKDQPTRVRFTSFNQRTTPELDGTVFRISPNTTPDRATGQPFFTVGIRIVDGQSAKLNGSSLLPGMVADTFITTDARTVMSFLLRPLYDNFQRVFSGR